MSAAETFRQGLREGPGVIEDAPSLYPEYLAAAGEELVTNDYVYGSLWRGVPGAMRELPVEGRYISVGGGGGRWAGLDAEGGTVVIGSADGYHVVKSRWASLAGAVAAGSESIWLALPEKLLQIALTGDVVLNSLPIAGGIALAVDAEAGRVAVACPEFHRVVLGCGRANNFRELKLICNRNLRFPRGVAFSPGGELWISDTENRRVVSADGSAVFDFTNHPGFPVGLTSHQDRLCVAFPYERLLTSATEAATGQWHGADFYPYAIARFDGDLWTSHPASGIVRSQREGVTHAGLADPIAMVTWRGHLAVAERDRACITCFRRADATRKILLPEGSQPRALAVSPDGVLWIATQTPKMLFACHDGWRAEPVCPLAVAGAPRAMAWTAEGIALAASSVNGILWINQNDGMAINEFPLPEPPVSLAADGDTVFAGLERRRFVIGLTGATVTEIAGEVITPRGLLPEGGQLHIVESLAHRVRRADVARAVHVV